MFSSNLIQSFRSSKILFAIFLLTFSLNAQAFPTFWNLPKTLDDTNTKVTFLGDCTWYEIDGVTSQIKGRAWLADPKDFTSIRGEISLPVRSLDTDSDLQNEKLWEVMSEERYKTALFTLTKISDLCNPLDMKEGGICEAKIVGNLKLLKTTKELEIPVKIKKTGSVFKLTGEFIMDWRDYEIEDPSMLVNKVDPLVKIFAEITL